MASITVRNLDDDVKKRLRKQAAEHGRSLEAEVREILSRSTSTAPSAPIRTGLDLFRGIRGAVEKFGGVELDIPPRTPMRDMNLFEEEAPPFRRAPPKGPKRRGSK